MNRLERIKGCLLGGVVGDALGQSVVVNSSRTRF